MSLTVTFIEAKGTVSASIVVRDRLIGLTRGDYSVSAFRDTIWQTLEKQHNMQIEDADQ